ncbi:MAG: hypothetical protein RMI34_01040 [Chloroherpetonaceae bacterium]|nr:hypothetical protein [Chloroherpetonaceae bacterium]MCS7211708.1 hypothetical protein [Chloroherpetonaceae bacterium]MDW8018646.1 hypothetical protein [Chloroherpetonaceae bacterium]
MSQLDRSRVWIQCIVGILVLLTACDQGLTPAYREAESTGRGTFRGVITFKNFPPPVPDSLRPDSLRELLLVVYRTAPSPETFLDLNILADTMFLRPFYVPALRYERTIAAGVYEYVAVAQHFRGFVLNPNDWRPVGVYGGSPENPRGKPLIVRPNQLTDSVNIDVDFWRPLPFPR